MRLVFLLITHLAKSIVFFLMSLFAETWHPQRENDAVSNSFVRRVLQRETQEEYFMFYGARASLGFCRIKKCQLAG